MDLARLGVDEIGLDPVAVAPEQRVRQRAVAPVDAVAVEVDEQERHRVEEPVAVDAGAGRQAHQQPPVLERVGEILRRQDRHGPLRDLGQAGGVDRRQRRPTRGGAGPRIPAGPAGSGSSLSAYRAPSDGRGSGPGGATARPAAPGTRGCPPASRRAAAPTAGRRGRSPGRGAGAGERSTSVGSRVDRGVAGEPAAGQVLVRAASSGRPRPRRRSRATRTGAGHRAGGGRR